MSLHEQMYVLVQTSLLLGHMAFASAPFSHLCIDGRQMATPQLFLGLCSSYLPGIPSHFLQSQHLNSISMGNFLPKVVQQVDGTWLDLGQSTVSLESDLSGESQGLETDKLQQSITAQKHLLLSSCS
jgi:hypothetical protein